jgi:hypothetical protein
VKQTKSGPKGPPIGDYTSRKLHSDKHWPIVLPNSFKVLEQILVEDEHAATLYRSPDHPGAKSAKPTCNAFRLIDYSQSSKN